MRLSQLARRLSVKTTEIVDFLSSQQVAVEDRPNARIEPDHMKLVIRRFKPELIDELMRTEDEVIHELDTDVVSTEGTSGSTTGSGEESIAGLSEEESTDRSELTEVQPEVIRAPKLELPGLRVVGKIDLPEPKKKEGPTDKEKLQDRSRERAQRDQGLNKNPITLQREKEERERLKRKREEEKKLKKLRKERYLKKVQERKALKESKPKPSAQAPGSQRGSTRPAPKTWLGRFFRWWTTP